jgi:hypothetical protein
MKIINHIIIGLLAVGASAFGAYWQQDVSYDMQVRLDTTAKVLEAHSQLSYVNHSPDSLDRMLMHLYHNAFNEGTIAYDVWREYGDQLDLSKGWTGITIHHVASDSTAYPFTIRDDTILDIELPKTLLPEDTLIFSIDWTLKIHPHIDRSGYQGDEYDFSQWYPKFVVYDENGWHDDPFGDWGEFYGEFGDYKIEYDLPASFIVGATGVVVEGDPGWKAARVDTSKSWDEWFEAYHTENLAFRKALPDSARRVVTFLAEDVHDVAWVTSPDYVYEHNSWDGIDIHVLFLPHAGKAWSKDVARHGASAVQWLSEKFGRYPWPQMTITQALLGGGMEYPMLIMDGSESESLIVHEIGHNWFYGLFGNDELDDAWLDEGFTTFQTRWYQEVKYPNNGYDLTRDNITAFEHEKLPRQMYTEAGFKPLLRYMLSPGNEPLATRSYDFRGYGSYRDNVYTKSSYMLQVLKNYLGEARFLAGMQLYYDRWAVKHVNETRFIKAMEDASGEELDWFFDQWLHTTKVVDYRLNQVETESLPDGRFQTRIEVENAGGFFVPISATLYSENGDTAKATLQEFRHRSHGTITAETDFMPVRVYLDSENMWLDVDRRNNDSKRKRSWRYDFKGWDDYPDDRNFYLWKPQFAYNDHDGLGLGVQVKRVYRNTGDHLTLSTAYNLASAQLDLGLSFRKIQVGLPIDATWYGSVQQWRETSFADLAYELKWSRRYDMNPIHWLSLMADHSEGFLGLVGYDPSRTHTRLGVKYELQDDLWGGAHGFSATIYHSLSELSRYIPNFNQLSLMNNWSRPYKHVTLNNRTNLKLDSKATPEILRSRLASMDLRSQYLDQLASSLKHIESIEGIGSALYLAGGGRMRGYADSLDISAHYLWSNNLDLTFKARYIGDHRIGFHGFFDLGQYSQTAQDWEWMSDFGFGLEFKPSWRRTNWVTTLIRPLSIKFEIPLARYVEGQYSSATTDNLWLFTISN